MTIFVTIIFVLLAAFALMLTEVIVGVFQDWDEDE